MCVLKYFQRKVNRCAKRKRERERMAMTSRSWDFRSGGSNDKKKDYHIRSCLSNVALVKKTDFTPSVAQ